MKVRKTLAALLSTAITTAFLFGTVITSTDATIQAAPKTNSPIVADAPVTTTAPPFITNPNQEYTRQYSLQTAPRKTVYALGEELYVQGSYIKVSMFDPDGNYAGYYSEPFNSPRFEIKCEPFTDPGEYPVELYLVETGELIYSYTVTVLDSYYPKTGFYARIFTFVDKDTSEPIQGLECELIDVIKDEVVSTWNTTTDPSLYTLYLNYQFDDAKGEDSYLYALRITNLSEMQYEITESGGYCDIDKTTGTTYYRLDSSYNQNGVPLFTTIENELKLLDVAESRADVTTKPITQLVITTAIRPTQTTTTTVTTTIETTVAPSNVVGDANCDGKVTIADAAAVLQYLGNKDRYPLSEIGILNSDCDGEKGLTTKDAVAIQEFVCKNK